MISTILTKFFCLQMKYAKMCTITKFNGKHLHLLSFDCSNRETKTITNKNSERNWWTWKEHLNKSFFNLKPKKKWRKMLQHGRRKRNLCVVPAQKSERIWTLLVLLSMRLASLNRTDTNICWRIVSPLLYIYIYICAPAFHILKVTLHHPLLSFSQCCWFHRKFRSVHVQCSIV